MNGVYLYGMDELFHLETPIGLLEIAVVDSCVTAIRVVAAGVCAVPPVTPFAVSVKDAIEGFFAGNIRELTFPVVMRGTVFQRMVWEELRHIPYGSVATYGEVAARIGKPGAARAVGMACNRNPLLIAVPCHRVVGAGGKLTGFAIGVRNKQFLLELEGR